jgi:predicted O-methyltransferase YrrM
MIDCKNIIIGLAMPVVRRYREILRRIHDLEVVVDSVILSPQWTDDPKTYFNGQEERQRIFQELVGSFTFTEVIETGTFLGNTTGYFAKSLPRAAINSCELTPRFHGLAKMRLNQFGNIRLFCSDSRAFLSSLKIESDLTDSDQRTFVYLDAHWHTDLPLREELEILKRLRPNAIVMIDDFEVDNDSGYSYDDYGTGKKLSFSNFRPIFNKMGYVPYSPVASSSEETGARRGCVIVALNGHLCVTLDKMQKIRRAF